MQSSSLSRRQASPAIAAEGHGRAAALPLDELSGFFRHATDLLAILDDRGRILQLSPSAHRLLGYPEGSLGGRRLTGLLHPDEVFEVRARLRDLAVEGVVSELDCRLRRSDGRWLAMQWSISVHAEGSRIYAVGRDRTRNLLERELGRIREDAELRGMLADELHDGILQAMSAGALQLEVARRLVRMDPAAAEGVLRNLSELITAEQREIRLFVDEMKRIDPLTDGERMPLAERLEAMLRRIDAIWDVRTSLQARLDGAFGPGLERAVLRIVQEAVINAVRHGKAGNVRVRAVAHEDSVRIRVTNDGRGFPFAGKMDDADLRERRLGPVSLKRRVARAGGRIAIRSTRQGTILQIALPRAGASS